MHIQNTEAGKNSPAKRKFCVTDEAILLLFSRPWGRCPASHAFELSADNGRRLLPATPAVPPFWCAQWLYAISIRWTSRTLMVLHPIRSSKNFANALLDLNVRENDVTVLQRATPE
jgi:hypothetical protein